MAGRPPNDRNRDADLEFFSPRGSIHYQLQQQPQPERHDYSYYLPGDHALNRAPLPDLDLHPDMFALFQTTRQASRIHPPYAFRPADAYGWGILNDPALLPCLDSYGGVTDGDQRVLGRIVSNPQPRVVTREVLLQLAQLANMTLGLPYSAGSFAAHPWQYHPWKEHPWKRHPWQLPRYLAYPGSDSANDSQAKTVVAQSYTGTDHFPVYDRNFDVGVTPL
jgi:hypothetical protein